MLFHCPLGESPSGVPFTPSRIENARGHVTLPLESPTFVGDLNRQRCKMFEGVKRKSKLEVQWRHEVEVMWRHEGRSSKCVDEAELEFYCSRVTCSSSTSSISISNSNTGAFDAHLSLDSNNILFTVRV